MKAEIKIPDGWRKLAVGDCFKRYDRWLDSYEMKWASVHSGGLKIAPGVLAIRKIEPTPKGTP